MEKCKVVIIDTGVNFKNNNECRGISIREDGKAFLYGSELYDNLGHGTIIFSIINECVEIADIFVVKLPDNLDKYDDLPLIRALEYVRDNINCQYINLSLGVRISEKIESMYNVCRDLSSKGVVIVSAFDNDGCYSYPASFDCVIGVDSQVFVSNENRYEYVEGGPINILAKGGHQIVKKVDGNKVITSGSSLACAHITAYLATNMGEKVCIDNAKDFLKRNAAIINENPFQNEYISNNAMFEIRNAVVFPFSKEMHALVRFRDYIPFCIQGYYDVKRSGKVGRSVGEYVNITGVEAIIRDINDISFEGIDCLVLGHLDELMQITKTDYSSILIGKAINNGINIFSFDPLEKYVCILEKSGIKYFYPQVRPRDVPQNTLGKMYQISKPVIAIFGTSSKQGKFTLMISIKKEMESRGYRIGTIGTEPHSLLFGCDYTFPIGYNSTVYLHETEIVQYLNHQENNLCMHGYDAILTAAQGQTVSYGYMNILEYPLKQYPFLVGVNPDAVILCINYYDEEWYIKKTIDAIQGLSNATVVAMMMFPKTYVPGEVGYGFKDEKVTHREYKEKSMSLAEEFHIPTYFLDSTEHIGLLCNQLFDFFSH